MSVADAVAAEKGGAGRLEVVRALEAGGLTPPISLVKDIVAAVSIPVRESTPIREFHVGPAARLDGDIHRPVDAARVEELAALVAS